MTRPAAGQGRMRARGRTAVPSRVARCAERGSALTLWGGRALQTATDLMKWCLHSHCSAATALSNTVRLSLWLASRCRACSSVHLQRRRRTGRPVCTVLLCSLMRQHG